MSRIEIRSEAERDIFDTALWYEQERAGLGFRFEVEVTRVLERIADHPRQFPILERGIRRAQTSIFPYAVFFRATEDAVIVVGVLHLHRHPNAWRRRG